MPLVIADQVLDADVEATFADAYDQVDRDMDSHVTAIMEMPQSRHHQSTYGTLTPAPHLELWVDAIPEEAMDSEQITVVNRRFGKRVIFREVDREDTEATIGGILTAVGAVGANAAKLPVRMCRDVLDGTTSLLPSTNLALDGAATYSATDGASAARFGRTGGNTIATGDSAGIATEEGIVQDRWACVGAMRAFLAKGQPMWSEDLLDQAEMIRFPATYERLFRQALQLDRSVVIVTESGANVGGFSPSGNAIIDQVGAVNLWPDPAMSDNGSWQWFKLGVGRKPLIYQRRVDPRVTWHDPTTGSDYASKYDRGFVDVRVRAGAGPLLPYNTVYVDNSA